MWLDTTELWWCVSQIGWSPTSGCWFFLWPLLCLLSFALWIWGIDCWKRRLFRKSVTYKTCDQNCHLMAVETRLPNPWFCHLNRRYSEFQSLHPTTTPVLGTHHHFSRMLERPRRRKAVLEQRTGLESMCFRETNARGDKLWKKILCLPTRKKERTQQIIRLFPGRAQWIRMQTIVDLYIHIYIF